MCDRQTSLERQWRITQKPRSVVVFRVSAIIVGPQNSSKQCPLLWVAARLRPPSTQLAFSLNCFVIFRCQGNNYFSVSLCQLTRVGLLSRYKFTQQVLWYFWPSERSLRFDNIGKISFRRMTVCCQYRSTGHSFQTIAAELGTHIIWC